LQSLSSPAREIIEENGREIRSNQLISNMQQQLYEIQQKLRTFETRLSSKHDRHRESMRSSTSSQKQLYRGKSRSPRVRSSEKKRTMLVHRDELEDA